MRKYQYVRVGGTEKNVDVWCSDYAVFDWLLNNTKRIMPSCTTDSEVYGLVDNKIIGARLRRLQSKGVMVRDWLVGFLCENGFEPFAHFGHTIETYLVTTAWLHLRKEITSDNESPD